MKNDLKDIVNAIAINDDHESFDKLFRMYFTGLLSYATSIVGDKQTAIDLVQDLFLKVWANRKTLNTINSISNYLYTSLKFNSIHYITEKRKRANFDNNNAELFSLANYNPEEVIIQKENVCKIEDAINTLPYKCRIIFRLIKEEGLKYKEVASLLEISVKTVESHMSLAYSRIVDAIEEILPSETNLLKKKKTS